ncbi:MAG: MFS transporter [Dehalococcoidia bacterium]|nr:MFS transporter [Dehalococcoidia bacterium]
MKVAEGQALGEVLNQRQKWLLLGSLMVAMFVGAIDQTVVTTATPKILADLGGFHLLSWLFTSYMLASTVVVPLVGKLSDMFGRKLFVLAGIVVFTISSAACGAAPTMELLIAARVVQGLGGGMIFASVFSTIGDIFPPSERGKYIGMFTGVFSLASVLGPTFGGFLTDLGGWRWIFYVNVPFSLIAIPAIWFNLPGKVTSTRPKIDFAGAVLLSVAAVALLLAFEWAGTDYAWTSPRIVGLLGVAVLFLAGFVVQETRHPEPIIPLHLFANRTFLLSNMVVFTLGVGMFGSLQYLAIFVQTSLGESATASGLITTPQSFGLLGASIIGGQLISRTGRYRYQTMLGAACTLIAMLFLRTLDVDVVRWHISAFMVVLGAGFGLVMPTMSLGVQNALPYKYLGVASSSNQFFRQIGSVFGVAIFAAVLTSSYETSFANDLPAEPAATLQATGTLDAFRDPTLPLNPREYVAVQQRVRAADGGDEALTAAESVQKASVAVAIRKIFTWSAIVAAITIGLVALMKEIPMRRDFGTSPQSDQPATPPVAQETLPAAGGGGGR